MIIKEYSYNDITIVWKPEQCIHSGTCVRMLPQVYYPKDKPWVKPENASTMELMDQISQCPSGALSLKTDQDQNIEIKQEDNGIKGVFLIFEGQTMAGEMTYVWAGEDKFIIDHTGVKPQFGERGFGKRLVLSAVEFARKNELKILPLCLFAKAEFIKNKNYADVKF